METNISKEIEKLEEEIKHFNNHQDDCGCEICFWDNLEYHRKLTELKALTQAKQMIKTAIDELKVYGSGEWGGDYVVRVDKLKAKLGVEDEETN
jgi:hypothetical protein